MIGDIMKNKKKIIKKNHKKHLIRILIFLFTFGLMTVSLGYNLFCNLLKIKEMKDEKITLNEKIIALKKEQKELELNINKLQDPNYIARYVREKYFYSKDGELILRIDE